MANEQTGERSEAVTSTMGKLRRLHDAGWNIRDVLVLDAIRAAPGSNGLEIGRKVEVASRSMVHRNIEKLVTAGYVADERTRKDYGSPNKLHITHSGKIFLGKLQ